MAVARTRSKPGSASGNGPPPLTASQAYNRAGLSGVPIRGDGSKAPAVRSWQEYQRRLPTDGELRRWYGDGYHGPAIVCGAVSGHLEVIDFDRPGLLRPWRELVEAEDGELLSLLSIVRTPRDGNHVYYRCPEGIEGNQKLAQEIDGRTGRYQTLIETRGEGGYVLAPGCPPACHPTGKLYEHVGGLPLSAIATITARQRALLLRCARSFDRSAQEDPPRGALPGDRGVSPGTDYNRRGPDWKDILEPHGWRQARTSGKATYWRRPDKDGNGWSATTGVCASAQSGELLAVFSSNAAPFDGPKGGRACSCHSKFAAYALLNHRGDFSAAAKELARQGYGDQRQQRQQKPNGRNEFYDRNADRRRNGKGTAPLPPPVRQAAPWEDPIPFAEYPRPEFPVDCLPPWLGDFVNALAESTQTPPDLAALLALALAGAGLAGKFRVKVRPSWTEPTNLYAATALQVGSRKSAVYAEAIAPVQEVEQEAVRHMGPRIAEAASKKRILENRLKGLEAKAAKEADETERRLLTRDAQQAAKELAETHVPALPEFFADDATPEKIAGLLAEQGGRLLVASAEGTIFDIIKGRYSDGPNFDVFLKGHSGDPVRVHRVGRESEYVERPALSLAVAVQPDVIQGLAAETTLRGRGLLGRILYAVPLSTVGRRRTRPEPLPEAIAARYRENMLALWRLEGGNDGPHLLELDAEADRLIEALESRLEPRLGPGGDLESVADWACKLAGAAARLAGILHVADVISGRGTWQPTVTRQSAEAAVSIAEGYLLPHARAALGLMGAESPVPATRSTRPWSVRRRSAPEGRPLSDNSGFQEMARLPSVEASYDA